jgi:hypothetical protein
MLNVKIVEISVALRRGLVVSSPPATEETETMGRVIESRQGGSFLKNLILLCDITQL